MRRLSSILPGLGLGATGSQGMLCPTTSSLLHSVEGTTVGIAPTRLTEPRIFGRGLALQVLPPQSTALSSDRPVDGLTSQKNCRCFAWIGISLLDNHWCEGLCDAERLYGEGKVFGVLSPQPQKPSLDRKPQLIYMTRLSPA